MRFFLSCAIIFLAYFAYVNSDACVQCNSAKDIKCAVDPGAFLAKECKNSTSKCYTRVQDGDTIRGCASDLDNSTASNCNNELQCLICSFTEGCNRQVFPRYRASCIQCSGNDENSTCATEIYKKDSYCPSYKLGDKCFIRKDGRNTSHSVERGCLSSIHAVGRCKKLENCYTCEGAGCNFLEISDIVIPLAKDSAISIGLSSILLLLGFMSLHFI